MFKVGDVAEFRRADIHDDEPNGLLRIVATPVYPSKNYNLIYLHGIRKGQGFYMKEHSLMKVPAAKILQKRRNGTIL